MMQEESKRKKLLWLFLSYLKIGAFTFGGGYAMISLLESEFVTKRQWIQKQEFLDLIAIAESSPGPVAINCATYVGYTVAGFWGSVLATMAVCIPSFFIIYVISLFFDRFLSLTYVGYAFRGIQVCVIYLIASAGVRLLRDLKRNWWNTVIILLVLAGFILFTLFSVQFSTVFYILICGVAGLVAYLIGRIRKGAGK